MTREKYMCVERHCGVSVGLSERLFRAYRETLRAVVRLFLLVQSKRGYSHKASPRMDRAYTDSRVEIKVASEKACSSWGDAQHSRRDSGGTGCWKLLRCSVFLAGG